MEKWIDRGDGMMVRRGFDQYISRPQLIDWLDDHAEMYRKEAEKYEKSRPDYAQRCRERARAYTFTAEQIDREFEAAEIETGA